ncbi:MAG: transposase [Pseudomonadota bacterium]|nr:transposase [Pseudomonadota bacterium]
MILEESVNQVQCPNCHVEVPIDDLILGKDKLGRDLRRAAAELTDQEARYLVDTYYEVQKYRVAYGNQMKAIAKAQEPSVFFTWTAEQIKRLEADIRGALSIYSNSDKRVHGQWLRSVNGIGPVLAAGILAHIDINRAPTVSHIYSFAGLDPMARWLKEAEAAPLVDQVIQGRAHLTEIDAAEVALALDKKPENYLALVSNLRGDRVSITRHDLVRAATWRPWNGRLKTLCWKVGESFVKTQNNKGDEYGRLYRIRKAHDMALNLRGEYQGQAGASLTVKKYGRDTEAYAWYSGQVSVQGARDYLHALAIYVKGQPVPKVARVPEGEGQPMLPPARIQRRAARYAVKIFLGHYHHVAYETAFGQPPPRPYPIDQLQRGNYFQPPNWPLGSGVTSATTEEWEEAIWPAALRGEQLLWEVGDEPEEPQE